MGGKKTVGQIWHEAIEQLKANYFQHVGLGGVYYAANMAASSLYYIVYMFGYLLFLIGYMVALITVVGSTAFVSEPQEILGVFLAPLLIFTIGALLFFFAVFLVAIAVAVVSGTVQAGVLKGVLMLLKGDKLTGQAVGENFRKNWKRYLGISAWMSLWTALWSLLLWVPGIYKSYCYMLAPYLVIEYPEMKVRDALKKSIEITKGHKGKLFVISLIVASFTYLSGIVASTGFIYVTLFAQVIFLLPLYFLMNTIAYLDIKQAAVEKGLLPGGAGAVPLDKEVNEEE